jgi:hypothetical protein
MLSPTRRFYRKSEHRSPRLRDTIIFKGLSFEREVSEGREPMLAPMIAGDMGRRCFEMNMHCRERPRTNRVIFYPRLGRESADLRDAIAGARASPAHAARTRLDRPPYPLM